MMRSDAWDRFVDIVTFLWLGLFALDIAMAYSALEDILFWCLAIYGMDLVVKYRRVGSFKLFLRHHWVSILMTVPYFRVLRLVRLFRLLRVMRAAKVVPGLKSGGVWQKIDSLVKTRFEEVPAIQHI